MRRFVLILSLIPWIYLVWYVSCFVMSLYFVKKYPKNEWEAQLYVLSKTHKSELMEKLLATEIDNGKLGDSVIYYRVYTDTTYMYSTRVISYGCVSAEYDERDPTYFYVFLKDINGYAHFFADNHGEDTHIGLWGYYLENCELDTIDNVVQLRGHYNELCSMLGLMPLDEREAFLKSFENGFLNRFGDFQRDDVQGMLAYVYNRFWKSASPHVFVFLAFILCVISLYYWMEAYYVRKYARHSLNDAND